MYSELDYLGEAQNMREFAAAHAHLEYLLVICSISYSHIILHILSFTCLRNEGAEVSLRIIIYKTRPS